MLAVVAEKAGTPAQFKLVRDSAVPTIQKDDDVLIRMHATALNPVDYKMVEMNFGVGAWPHVFGCDGAGVVEKVGPKAKNVKPGDRVCVYPLLAIPGGTFAEFLLTSDWLVVRIPDSLSFENATALPVSVLTAMLMVEDVHKNTGAPALVYGAASSVGQSLVQLAKLNGSRVVAVASERNHALLRSLGADACVDYRADGWKQQAADALRNGGSSVKAIGLDAIGGKCSVDTGDVLALANGGNKEGLLVASTDPFTQHPADAVPVRGVNLGFPDQAVLAPLVRKLEQLVLNGKIKPNPVSLIEQGLAGIPAAFVRMSEGRVSGEKLVARLADTPSS